LLIAMKKTGCYSVQLGVESGSERILKLTSKGSTPEDALRTAQLCQKHDLTPGLNFILGLPHETTRDAWMTFRLAVRLRPYVNSVNFAILVPFPGTAAYHQAHTGEGGIQIRSRDWRDYGKQAGLAVLHDNFPGNRLQQLQALFLIGYYLGAPKQLMKRFTFGRVFRVLWRLFGSPMKHSFFV